MRIKNWEYERCINILTMLSLDAIIGTDQEGNDVTLGDTLIDTHVDNYEKILKILLGLTSNDKERKIILYLADGYDLTEIAKKLNKPRTTINDVLKRFRKNIPMELKNSLLRGEI